MSDKSFIVKAFTKWEQAKENITETPYLKGQTFEGWSLNRNGQFIDDQYQFIQDTNIYPIYQTSYIQVNLNLGEGVSETTYIRVQRDSTFDENTELFNIDIQYIGYQLDYWSLSENGDPIPSDYIFTTNITFYAVYQIKYITLNLHSISQLPEDSLQIQQGTYYKDIKQQLEIELQDYIFNGWSLNDSGTPLINDNYQFLNDTDIFASFTYDTSITVRFYTYDDNYIEVKANEGDTLHNVLDTFDQPQRENWLLYGWSTENNYNGLVDNDLYIIEGNISLYAIWVFNITINLQNDYPELLESNGIIGTFLCAEGETVQNILSDLIQSNNYQKLTSVGSFVFDHHLYKDGTTINNDYVLQPQDNNLFVKLKSNKIVYKINQLYTEDSTADDFVQFEFDTITTLNDLFNEFKKYAQPGYDLYGDIIGFDYNNSTTDIEMYDDGLYLNFNTLNNINIDFNSCGLTFLTLAIKQTKPFVINRGWLYDTAIQVNGIMSPYTSFVDKYLLSKIKNICNDDATITNGYLVWIDNEQNIYSLEASDTYQSVDETTGEVEETYNSISLVPSENEKYFTSESHLYNGTIYFNHWNNLQFPVGISNVGDNDSLIIEIIYMKSETGRYKSVVTQINKGQTSGSNIDYLGFNIFNLNDNVKIYMHNNTINGIEKIAAILIHQPGTGEITDIIQLNRFKMGDVFGVNEIDWDISDRLIEAGNLQMPIIY